MQVNYPTCAHLEDCLMDLFAEVPLVCVQYAVNKEIAARQVCRAVLFASGLQRIINLHMLTDLKLGKHRGSYCWV